jgi:glycosyltransferase involved in cell wall biosynthesis
MLNIALLHYTVPPVVGGVEEIVKDQALLFKRNFINVKVFAGAGSFFDPSIPVEINPLLGSSVSEIETVHDELKRGDKSSLRVMKKKILEYLRSALEGFDILIAHNVLTMRYNLPLTFAVHDLASSGEVKVISWNHDSLYFYDSDPFYHKPPFNILKRYNPHIQYVAISSSRKKQFQKIYRDNCKITVIPNGIDPISFFMLNPTTVRIIQEERLLEADFIMVQPSRLHPRKNIELSLRVTRALVDLGVDALFLLTGSLDPHEKTTRRYYRKLQNLKNKLGLESNAVFLTEYTLPSGEQTYTSQALIRDLYLLSDVLFMPSLQEGFGLPMLEAGMVKLPVVCSDIPPFREIGRDNVMYFALDDAPADIAGKIMEFISRSPVRNHFRNVIKNYSWDNIFKASLLPFLQRVMNRKS